MATKITIEEIWERIPEDGKGYISWAQIASQYQVAHNTIAKKVPQIKPFLIEKYIMGGEILFKDSRSSICRCCQSQRALALCSGYFSCTFWFIMLNPILKFKKLDPSAIAPFYAHPGDAGLDLSSIEDVLINPGERKLVRTGIAIELPEGFEAQVRPRSGLALKHGVTVLNTPGTIDTGYRGEICVILINHCQNWFKVGKGMRIAQLAIAPVVTAKVVEIERLESSDRGDQGFGSTGE